MFCKKKNGFSILQKISNILTGETITMKELPEDLTGEDLVYFNYVCITSTDVERSFSHCKNVLSNNRRRFQVDNLKNVQEVQCNKFISIKKLNVKAKIFTNMLIFRYTKVEPRSRRLDVQLLLYKFHYIIYIIINL